MMLYICTQYERYGHGCLREDVCKVCFGNLFSGSVIYWCNQLKLYEQFLVDDRQGIIAVKFIKIHAVVSEKRKTRSSKSFDVRRTLRNGGRNHLLYCSVGRSDHKYTIQRVYCRSENVFQSIVNVCYQHFDNYVILDNLWEIKEEWEDFGHYKSG